jgi:cytochrome c5
MLATAKKGKGAMPPKGTCMGCSDADLKAAIEYMVSQSK